MALLKNRWIAMALQTILGGIFIWASIGKIQDPPDFAHMVYNYKLTPGWLINLVAIYLPWVEWVIGVALITGLWNRGATAIVGGLLVLFIALLTINLARNHAIDCGCFEVVVTVEKTHEELLTEMRWVVARDVGMLVMVAWIFVAGRIGRPWLPGWSERRRPETAHAAG